MSFRLTVQLSANSQMRGYSECAQAHDAFTIYRRFAETQAWTIEIIDLRDGQERSITGPELEAIAQSEHCDRFGMTAQGRERGYDQ